MNSEEIVEKLKRNIKLSNKNKSSYWQKHLDKKDEGFLDYLDENKVIAGAFIKKNFIKNYLHVFFQTLIFGHKLFSKDIYKKYKNVFDTIDRQINSDTIRHIFTFDLIKKNIKPKKICIIGDGKINGLLGAHLSFPNAKIFSCNLSEVLINENLIINKTEIELKNSMKLIESEDENDANYKLILVPSNFKNFLYNKNIDLFINIASFQEMMNEEVNNYFDLIKNNKSYLYCCNREYKKLYDGEELIFDKYPWNNCNKIIFENCPWFQRYYSFRFPFINKYDGNIKHAFVKFN